MHDVLAHTLSALSLQLEGARLIVDQGPTDPAVGIALQRAGRLTQDGLVEARRAMGSLRGDDLPGPNLLPVLASDFERDSGVPCRLEVEGTAVELRPDVQLALYRTAQGTLTNVRKHVEANGVDISLRYSIECVEMVVEDRGACRSSPLPGGGYGLVGLRERAELVGGTLEAGPTPAGFRVRLWVPL